MVTDLDIHSLKAMSTAEDAAVGTTAHVPLGLAKAQATFEMNMQAQIEKHSDGTVCVGLTQVNVRYAFVNTAIYIAQEIPYGTCLFGEVEAHERRHVEVDGQLLREWQYRLQQDAQYAAANIGVVSGYDQTELMERIKTRLRASISESSDALIGERRRRQEQVDSRMEYDRISRACDGQAQDIVRRALGH